jgi:hypothetical protein
MHARSLTGGVSGVEAALVLMVEKVIASMGFVALLACLVFLAAAGL